MKKTVLFILLSALPYYSYAQEQPAPESPGTPESLGTLEELLNSLPSLRNPFLSQILKEQKVKTPVEAEPQKVNNHPEPAHPPEVKSTSVLPEAASEPLPSMDIQGIIWGSDLPQAIIDGRVVGVGDKIQKAKITAIDKSGITFLFQGRKTTIAVK